MQEAPFVIVPVYDLYTISRTVSDTLALDFWVFALFSVHFSMY